MRLKILPCFRLADGKLKHHQPAVGKAEGGHGARGAGVLRMYVRHVAGANIALAAVVRQRVRDEFFAVRIQRNVRRMLTIFCNSPSVGETRYGFTEEE